MSGIHNQTGGEKSPDELLSTYTEQLELIQNRISDLGEPEQYTEKIQDNATRIIGILGKDSLALVSGKELLIPEINRKTGQYKTVKKTDCLERQLKDIICIQSDEDERSATIYYRFISDVITIDDPYQYTQSSLYMLAPVSSSKLHLPFDFEGAFTLDNDDQLASRIDELLLNTPMDLLGLSTLVSENFTNLNDLQRYSYLKRMNTSFNFQNVEITADRYIIIDDEYSQISELYTGQSSVVCEGAFQSFITCATEIQEYPDLKKESLVLVIKTQSNYTGIFIDDIRSIKTF